MKKLSLLFILIFLNGCAAIQQLSNEKIVETQTCAVNVLHGKRIFFDMEIDHVNTKFLLDTGAGLSALIDSTIVIDFKDKKFGYLGSAKGADRKKVKNRFFTVALKSDLFKSDNKVLSFINFQKSKCDQSKTAYTGILGMDAFFNEKLMLQLDFTNNKVCNIDDKQRQQCLLENKYHLLKSKCKLNMIFIYLKIEGKEYPFKLDTGYTGNIVMPYSDALNFKNENNITLEGSVFQTISSHTNGKEILYEKMPISFAGQNFESKLNVSTSIKAQNIGIEFIKAFDWLIDYNHNKVYVKRNQTKIESAFTRKVSYYVKADQDQLKIVVKEKSQTSYHLGDQIIAVNNQKVTAENNCEFQDLLNKTEDWSTLQLEVISNQH